MYRHLLICTAAPPATKTKRSNVAEQKEEKKRRVLSLSAPSFRTPTKSRRVSYGGSVPTTPTRRESNKAEDKEFHLDIAMAFYTTGIPFRAIDNPYLRRALAAIAPTRIYGIRVIGEVEAVASVGKVIAIVSDYAANMKKAGLLVKEKYPNVVFNGCSVHAVNLLLKDMFKIELLAQVLKKAVNLVKFVRARHLLLGRLRAKRRQHPSRTGERSVPVSTRWYTQEKCIKSVLRNKTPLKSVFADTELMKHYSDAATAENSQIVLGEREDRLPPDEACYTCTRHV
ncbi:hypothetical protein ON010_g10201 [Phytophthora cinnamomi]|nr:hypothetical protein ON010_g10201 [Phytophthora cinnamomi]